jgi:hypothetical protein
VTPRNRQPTTQLSRREEAHQMQAEALGDGALGISRQPPAGVLHDEREPATIGGEPNGNLAAIRT